MNEEENKTYRKLQRQINEAYTKYRQQGSKGKPNLFNNRLKRMKEFLSSLSDKDYSNNRFMKMEYL